MKDYTLGESLFILNYKRKNNNLILYLNNGKKVSIPYSIENEKQILKTMEEQLLDARRNGLKEKIKNDNTKSKEKFFKIVMSIIGVMSIITLAIATVWGPAALSYYTLLGTLLLTIGPAFKYNKNAIKNYILLKDYEKNECYIENANELKNYDLKENKKLLLHNTSSDGKKILNQSKINEDIPSININSIDKMSIDDLKNIRKNIISYNCRDIDTFLEEKGISYTKK